jgi:hypothetical protein
MILELPDSEIRHLLDNKQDLNTKIQEALNLLRETQNPPQ